MTNDERGVLPADAAAGQESARMPAQAAAAAQRSSGGGHDFDSSVRATLGGVLARASTLSRALGASVALVNRERRVIYVAGDLAALAGEPPERLIGRPLHELLGAHDGGALDIDVEHWTSRPPFAARLRRADGAPCEVLVRARVLVGAGEPLYTLTIVPPEALLQAERAFESSELFHRVAGSLRDVLIVHEIGGAVRYVSPSVERALGLPPEKVVGRSFVSLLWPADAARSTPEVRAHLHNGGSYEQVELHLRHADGRKLPFECTLTGMQLSSGQTVAVTVARDISERKAAGAQLAAMRELEVKRANRMQALFKLFAARTGHSFFRELVQRACALLHMEFGTVARYDGDGRRADTVAFHADGRDAAGMQYDLAGRPAERLLQQDVYICVDDVVAAFPGTPELVQWKIRGYAGAALRAADGRVIGWLAFFGRRPITEVGFMKNVLESLAPRVAAELERWLAEDELSRTSRLLAKVAAIARLGGWEYDRRTRRARLSPEIYAIHGVSEAEWVELGGDALALYTPQTRPVIAAAIGRCARGGVPFDIEAQVMRVKQGDAIWVRVQGEPEFDDQGRVTRFWGTLRDIDEQKRREQELARSEQLYRTLADNINDLVTLNSLDGRYRYVSPSISLFGGITAEEVMALSVQELLHPDDMAKLRDYTRRLLRGERADAVVYRGVRKGGGWCWLEGRGRIVKDPQTGETQVLMAARDVTEKVEATLALERSEHQYRYLAHHDALTGLPNRQALNAYLESALAVAAHRGHKVAALFVDLDRFKEVNDVFGHATGDKLLVEVAARFRSVLRAADFIARLGGDEFLVLIENTPGLGEVEELARRLLEALLRPYTFDGHEAFVSASIGIALYPEHASSGDGLFAASDIAMYVAKSSGRSCYKVYEAPMGERRGSRLRTEQALRHALERRELYLVYQPQVSLATGRMVGAEALIRWQRDGGMVNPAEFIPVAEETGLILPIGRWVLEETFAQLARWRERGHDFTVSCNLSMRQLYDPGFLDVLRATLAAHPLAASRVELELTESMLAHDVGRAGEVLAQIKKLGCRLAIDDFGTGYSSLMYLARFPLDSLKIDREFIGRMPVDADSGEIVKAVIALSHALGLSVVAEGVETREQQAGLESLACDAAQGYLFGKPMLADELERFALARHLGPRDRLAVSGAR